MNKLPVRFLKKAQYNLTEIGDFIAEDNPMRAVSFVEEIRIKCNDLANFPYAFPALIGFPPLRKRSYKGYIILYRVTETAIEIVHIVNSVRDYTRLLKS
jgi:toxin ParE1/3/4